MNSIAFESGRSLSQSVADLPPAAQFFQCFSRCADRLDDMRWSAKYPTCYSGKAAPIKEWTNSRDLDGGNLSRRPPERQTYRPSNLNEPIQVAPLFL
jgi:hypothetical protein